MTSRTYYRRTLSMHQHLLHTMEVILFLTLLCTTVFAAAADIHAGLEKKNISPLSDISPLNSAGSEPHHQQQNSAIDMILDVQTGVAELTRHLLTYSAISSLSMSHSNVDRARNVSLGCLAAFAKSSVPVTAIDAFGKPASGILGFNFMWLGNMDECFTVNDYHHCVADMQLEFPSGDNNTLKEPISWGVCLPSKCNEDEIEIIITDVLETLSINWFHISGGKSPNKVHCAAYPPKAYSNGFICVLTITCIIALLMVLGALLDVYIQKYEKSAPSSVNAYQPITSSPEESNTTREQTPLLHNPTDSNSRHELNSRQNSPISQGSCVRFIRKFLLCFAFNRSLDKCLNAKQSEKNVSCLNGIRVLSMCWVILSHSLLYPLSNQLFLNTRTAMAQFKSEFHYTVVMQGELAVDSFFFLSGFLLTYLSLDKMMKTNGKLPWGLFYVHRYLRLTPVYGSVILFLLFIDPYIFNGPLWYRYRDHPECEKYWWRNLLYISNLFPKSEMCMAWSWYLPNDMQFFAISPVILVLLYRRPKIGVSLVSILTLVSISIRFTMNMVFAQPSLGIGNAGGDGKPGYWDAVYDKPYTRVPPYFVGILLGFVVAHRPRIRMRKIWVVLGWALAWTLGLTNVYVYFNSINREWSTVGTAFYNSLSPFLWSLCLCWLVIACKNGYGGWINTFLSWKLWEPLSRLTFTVYLVHPIIIRNIYFARHNSFHVDSFSVSSMYVSNVVLCHGVALLFTLAIEFPFANLEKWLLSSFIPKSLADDNSKKSDNRQEGAP